MNHRLSEGDDLVCRVIIDALQDCLWSLQLILLEDAVKSMLDDFLIS